MRHSLYDSLRQERQRQIEEVRARALGAAVAAGSGSGSPGVIVVESDSTLAVKETLGQALLGYLALAVALVVVFLGVVILVVSVR